MSVSEGVKGVKSLGLQKKLAMQLFRCGERKVWVNPDVTRMQSIAQARTMDQIIQLVKIGDIRRKWNPWELTPTDYDKIYNRKPVEVTPLQFRWGKPDPHRQQKQRPKKH